MSEDILFEVVYSICMEDHLKQQTKHKTHTQNQTVVQNNQTCSSNKFVRVQPSQERITSRQINV